MGEWFEDESFWYELYPFLFPEIRFKEADAQVEQILELLQLKEIAVLDLCCGPGRISSGFARRGCSVTGVDLSTFLLGKARERAGEEGLEIEFVQSDMRDFLRPEAFDLVVNFFTSFGYFENKEDDVEVLAKTIRNLKPGGKILIELFGKEILAKVFQPSHADTLEDGSILLERHEIFDGWSRIRNEWVLIKDERAKTFRFHHTLYSGQELRDRLESVGFSEVELYGNLNGDDYGIDAERLIAVGQKPNS